MLTLILSAPQTAVSQSGGGSSPPPPDGSNSATHVQEGGDFPGPGDGGGDLPGPGDEGGGGLPGPGDGGGGGLPGPGVRSRFSLPGPGPGSGLPFSIEDGSSALAHSTWFALASGLASILALVLTLYTTQIRGLPFSLYRSLIWRKSLLMTFGVGLAIFSLIHLHTQILAGTRLGWWASDFRVSRLWDVLLVVGLALCATGLLYDPRKHLNRLLLKERRGIRKAFQDEVRDYLTEGDLSKLSPMQREPYYAARDFYARLEARLLDSALGHPMLPIYQGIRVEELLRRGLDAPPTENPLESGDAQI